MFSVKLKLIIMKGKNMDKKNLTSSNKEDLKKLSDEVHKVIEDNGFASPEACKTVCSASIDSNGNSVITCKLVCDL